MLLLEMSAVCDVSCGCAEGGLVRVCICGRGRMNVWCMGSASISCKSCSFMISVPFQVEFQVLYSSFFRGRKLSQIV